MLKNLYLQINFFQKITRCVNPVHAMNVLHINSAIEVNLERGFQRFNLVPRDGVSSFKARTAVFTKCEFACS
jgi:hypothetical protein